MQTALIPFILALHVWVPGLSFCQSPAPAQTSQQQSPNQPAPPLSRADRDRIQNQGSEFVRAVNSGSPETALTTAQKIFSEETLARLGAPKLSESIVSKYKSLGELEFHHAELMELPMGDRISRVLHVFARSKASGWMDFQFRVEPNPPYKLKELAFIANVAEPVYLPNGDIADPATLAWLSQYIDKLIEDNDLSGSVLISQGGKPLLERAFGFADAKRTQKITLETRFNLGSGNKMFTAIAIAQLVEQGKLKYSDPLIQFLPDFPDPAFARKVTIHHLLSHTSGINEYWTSEFKQQRVQMKDLKQFLPWIYKVGTGFEPGSQFAYSNSNFILAGLIIEKASRMDYFEYIRQHIYKPLGMTASDSYLMDGSVPNLASPLKKTPAGWEVAPHGRRGSSAGGGFSTPRDIVKYAQGLANGKVVSPASFKLLTTSKTRSLNSSTDYGYGFILEQHGTLSSYGHGGITSGVNFEFRHFPHIDLTVVLFCNQDNGAYDDLRKNIIKLISGVR